MKILTVASPHAVATRDVYTGHLAGLKRVLGEENVMSYDIIKRFNMFTHFTEWMETKILKTEETGRKLPRSFASNMLAAEPVFGAAHTFNGQLGNIADVVYLISPMYFPMTVVELLRSVGIKVWAYFTECPYEDEFWSRAQAPLMDACFVSDRQSLARFRAFNPNTHYLPHCYDPEVHHPRRFPYRLSDAHALHRDNVIVGAPATNDHEHIMFVGTGFPSRQQFLESVDWTDLDLRLWGNWWQVEKDSPLHPYVRPRLVENHTTAALYRGSKIGISMHRTERFYRTGGLIDKNEAYSIGPRAYELAACGLFTVSDPRPELVDVFGEGYVPTFETPEELGRLVRYYLKHDDEREAITRHNLEAVQGHTVEARARQMLSIAA